VSLRVAGAESNRIKVNQTDLPRVDWLGCFHAHHQPFGVLGTLSPSNRRLTVRLGFSILPASTSPFASAGSLALPSFPTTIVRQREGVFFLFISEAHADKTAGVEH
jgi:hypothetical protein